MDIESLLRYWKGNYYTDGLVLLMAIVAIVVISKNKLKTINIFTYYFAAFIILKSFYFSHALFISNTSFHHTMVSIDYYADYIFTLFEFYIFVSFFKTILGSSVDQKILKWIFWCFSVIGITILIHDVISYGYPEKVNLHSLFIVQAISLLVPCTLYYIHLFKDEPTLNLLNEPSFWIVTGLSFFMVCTLPYSFFIDYLLKTDILLYGHLFSIFHIFYLLLFTMIIRAHLCKPIATK
jgi:hypothetical protein